MKFHLLPLVIASAALIASSAMAQKKYDVGADDKEIKLGHINPYSGPASAYAAIGKSIGELIKLNLIF